LSMTVSHNLRLAMGEAYLYAVRLTLKDHISCKLKKRLKEEQITAPPVF
jgi:hypothetical protein